MMALENICTGNYLRIEELRDLGIKGLRDLGVMVYEL
jgi:hypothetical protein